MARPHKAKSPGKRTASDAGAYAEMLARTRDAARVALDRYSEPRMTLEQLRSAVAVELPSTSLAEVVVKEREAGW